MYNMCVCIYIYIYREREIYTHIYYDPISMQPIAERGGEGSGPGLKKAISTVTSTPRRIHRTSKCPLPFRSHCSWSLSLTSRGPGVGSGGAQGRVAAIAKVAKDQWYILCRWI